MVSRPADVWTRLDIRGVPLVIRSHPDTGSIRHIAGELRADVYGADGIAFAPGDVVVDVGAHVGVFALYVAARHPEATVFCCEPVPDTFEHLCANIAANGATNVVPLNTAVTADGRAIEMAVLLDVNSAGATAYATEDERAGADLVTAESVTLDDLFDSQAIDRCRLLKMDCEGSEHEILTSARCLDRVDFLAAEFHINPPLERAGHSIAALYERCARFIPPDRIRYTTWEGAFTDVVAARGAAPSMGRQARR